MFGVRAEWFKELVRGYRGIIILVKFSVDPVMNCRLHPVVVSNIDLLCILQE